MIALGLVPPYIDIYKERRVRGFSFIFLMIDMGGAFFSLLSLCTFHILPESNEIVFEQFDPLAAAIYIVLSISPFYAYFRWSSSWKVEYFYATGTFF
jgi:hypothetical protein